MLRSKGVLRPMFYCGPFEGGLAQPGGSGARSSGALLLLCRYSAAEQAGFFFENRLKCRRQFKAERLCSFLHIVYSAGIEPAG